MGLFASLLGQQNQQQPGMTYPGAGVPAMPNTQIAPQMPPNGGAPQLPQMQPQGGATPGAMQHPPMAPVPGTTTGMPAGATATPGSATGMFASLASNPLLMQALAKSQGQGGGTSSSTIPGNQSPFMANQGSFNGQGNALPSQLPWQNIPGYGSGSGGNPLQALMAMFGGGAAS